MGRSSFRGAAALQAAAKPRSFILDPPTKPTKAKPVLQAPDAADNNAYLKILASPLRLCALTEKVLPKELMINLKTVLGPLPTDGRPRLLLTPDRIMHPRFAESIPGKGKWVLCRRDALEYFQGSGNYKRLHPTAMFPSVTTSRIQFQLASRVQHESILFSERIKSRAGDHKSGGTRVCPVRRMTWEEVEDATKDGHLGSLAVEGQELVGLVIISEVEAGGGTSPFSALLPLNSPTLLDDHPFFPPSLVPIFHLPTFVNTCIVPRVRSTEPIDFSKPAPPPPLPVSPAFLVESVRESLDSLVDLFLRRAERLALGTTAPTPPVPIAKERDERVAAYAVYAPVLETTGSLDDDGVADSAPLVVALWRCRLWVGEGWGNRPEKENARGEGDEGEEGS